MMHKSKLARSFSVALLAIGGATFGGAETLPTLDFTGYSTATDAQLQAYIAAQLGSAVTSVTLTGAEGGGAPCGGSASGDCTGGSYGSLPVTSTQGKNGGS